MTGIFRAAKVFDGTELLTDHALIFGTEGLDAILPASDIANGQTVEDCGDVILCPGFTDLQVNGGGGVLLNDAPTSETVARIATAHWRLGTRALLPTLITDTFEVTQAAIQAVKAAIAAGAPGVIGLHLEGPHLSLARKGAHKGDFIRPMEDRDLQLLLQAARNLPLLKVTIAPENVTPEQVRVLAQAGVLVSLGHTDTDFATCQAYQQAGARCVTHLFNAQSQMRGREPGVVGAALGIDGLWAGLIADGVHVHPQMMQLAFAAKGRAEGEVFLVSDAMAVAGSDAGEFMLNGRKVLRGDGRLTLEDGTLAGADLDMLRAVHVLIDQVGLPAQRALRAATTGPLALIGRKQSLLGRPVTNFLKLSPQFDCFYPLEGQGNNVPSNR
ncbi:N-acetylglucosamine-6-phosphate deacetylase [Tritonibacter multivorans]|uniref:N-acetylglucosamine-6-phosphate deacetylase n=1 Tax=Tritonibacter multivorans TaxID=928856 RepID=A0A0P1GHJ4_9RHOB|nr:N-acetylglucosamine-6-phosphate deacetylase [Tritonibacter multivorans]MDA7420521.1 N-acetylglucosamine-6-phosphate deacetylase [Tritonibacter multivorans]CUH81435.1 N-acetylglucosamine-6-phosphate deacetylase [Tritonibacter multivorans]SFC35390.1 N-acetylglucosamine 6-phosphate deacetylase [Tritonibacter multivorans]